MAERRETCGACGGSGKFIGDPDNPCYKCHGHGYIIIEYNDSSSSSSSSYTPSNSGGGGSGNNQAARDRANRDFNEGCRLFDEGDYENAIPAFTRSLLFFTQSGSVYSQRGLAYTAKGEFDRAIADYTKAISIETDGNIYLVTHYIRRAQAYNRSEKDYDKALADSNKAIELGGEKIGQAYFQRSEAYRGMKNTEKANADLKKAADYGFEEARVGYEIFVVLQNNRAIAEKYSKSGMEHLKNKDADKAIADCTKAIEQGAGQYVSLAYKVRGIAYYNKDDIEKAIPDYKMAADFGDETALESLKENMGVDYTPEKRDFPNGPMPKWGDPIPFPPLKESSSSGSSGYSSSSYTQGSDSTYGDSSGKSKGVLVVLSIFFGWLGADRFYAGRIGLGIVKLLSMGIGIGFIWWIIDIIFAITGKQKDAYGNYIGSSSSGSKRSGFVSFLFGAVIGFGFAFTAYWVCKYLSVTDGLKLSGAILGALIAGFIITFLAWRNRKNILFFIMLALSIPGLYGIAGEIKGQNSGAPIAQTVIERTSEGKQAIMDNIKNILEKVRSTQENE